jgi:hypothetical protein
MDSVWIATIRACLNRCLDLAARFQRGDGRKQIYLIVMRGASVVCGKRPVPGAQSSVTAGSSVRMTVAVSAESLIKAGRFVKTKKDKTGHLRYD